LLGVRNRIRAGINARSNHRRIVHGAASLDPVRRVYWSPAEIRKNCQPGDAGYCEEEQQMPWRIRWIWLALAWLAATYGVLAVERIPGDYAHAFCGPWGCLPRLQALAAIHGFWLMVLLPPTAWLVAIASPLQLRLLGLSATSAGLFGLSVVVGRDLLAWSESTDQFWRYAAARAIFTTLMTKDLPFGQLALAGSVLWLVGARRQRATPESYIGPDAAPGVDTDDANAEAPSALR
jgi:hypothetical protein